jgi:hypothetical protein
MMNNVQAVLLENIKEFVGSARKRLGDPELAADVVQDSLLKALVAGSIQARRNTRNRGRFSFKRNREPARASARLCISNGEKDEITVFGRNYFSRALGMLGL